MKKVERHQISTTVIIEKFLNRIIGNFPLDIKGLQEYPHKALGTSLGDMQEAFHYSLCANHPKEQTLRFLRFFSCGSLVELQIRCREGTVFNGF
jgi:hypothetical protein